MTQPEQASPFALPALCLAVLLPSLGMSIANVALPTLATHFELPFQRVQWVVLAYLLATTALSVVAGRLGDRFGRRRVLLAGIALFSAASLLGCFASSFVTLLVARTLQGVGAAAMLALTLALVGETVPASRTGRAMGLLATMSAIGTALGPTMGGLLIDAAGWPAIFLALVPPGLLAAVLAWRVLPAARTVAAASKGFDWPGTIVLALSLIAYALAMTLQRGHIGFAQLALLGAGAVGALLFVWIESRAAAPLLQLGLLRDAALRAGVITSALVSMVMMTTLVVGPFYLSHGLGLSAAGVGLALAVGPLVSALCGVPAGRSVDRFGAATVALWGLAAVALGAALLAGLSVIGGLVAYLAPLALMTADYAHFQAANNTAVMATVPAGQRGAVSGLLSLARNLGLVSGASLMAAVFARAVGGELTSGSGEALTRGLQLSFGVATLCALAAFALQRRLPHPHVAKVGVA